jgi:uncharacterized protein YbjT (DUF2867 family)
MSTKTALLAGATGLVGGFCLRKLLENPRYGKVVVLGRRLPDVQHPRLEAHKVDFDKLEEQKDLLKADDIYCCLGTTISKADSREAFSKVDYAYPLHIARIAAENGASRFLLVSAMGADSRSYFFYNRVKGQVEEAVKTLPFRFTGIFRPSLLLGPRREKRFGEKMAIILAQPLAFLFSGPLRKYRPVQAEAVAAAMVAAAGQELEGVHVFESDRIAALGA